MRGEVFPVFSPHHGFVIGPVAEGLCCKLQFALAKHKLQFALAKHKLKFVVRYLFKVLYLTRCGVKSLPNLSIIIVS